MVTNEQKIAYKELLKENKKITKKVMKKFKMIYLISFFVGIALGVGLVVIDLVIEKKGIMKSDIFNKYVLLGIALFFVFFVIHVIIHEAGHMVFGLMTGYKFLSFRIFSLTFVKKEGKIQRKKFSIGGTAGQCLMYPTQRRADGRYPFLLYNLGGGLANLITSLPFLFLAIYVDNGLARTIFVAFCISGILLGITNIIPLDAGIQNDGMNIAYMLKEKCFRDGFYLQLQVNAEMSDGKLITDYDLETFDLPEGANDTNMLTVFNRMYSYYWFLANEDYESAYNILMKMSEKLDKHSLGTYNLIQAERLFFMVLYHKPIEEIAALYYRTKYTIASGKTNIGIQRVRYIYEALLTEDEKKDIMSLIKKKELKKWKATDLEKLHNDIIKTAEKYPVEGEAKMHIDIMNSCVFSEQFMIQ